ncbi:MAG TPA: Smr/MutS family protein [Geminicoccaceae bacterium]
MAGGRRRERRLTDDELALWRGAVRSARPLRPGELGPPPPPAPEDEGGGEGEGAGAPAPRTRPSGARLPAQPGPALDPDRPIGLDRRSWERLRRGRMSIDARLDLHGDTQEVAHLRLEGFLRAAQARGQRCVLVVTGKGQASGGILRHMVPRWLAEPHNRNRLVAYAPAQREHGGTGALYVLVRRRRGES